MLDEIRFKGFDLEGSSLSIHDDDNSEGGKYSLKFSEHRVVPQKDEDGNWVFIEVKPSITGYPRDKEEVDDGEGTLFRAEATITLTFECNLADELSEEFYNENSWFFENYVYICTKIVFENMFKNTILDTINLPWSPKSSD
ncbi:MULTISPECIES: hypothetical protein [Klebsiella pneumoniae complex]|uniref:hypothetical protein n=1 Tax=Klebsiella pneumoniae complex TaxID=3390273 RepID=UPI000DE6000D|nr:hypothetical protein [Klebsiella pneumoniae]MDW5800416.1 hypothetical protein [Klebsiella pneumoniae]MDW5836873.1 hypothetical protein [Klebsiella pneumoniae]MDW5884983.1 hypothetical protein [Klebsiella pneumoniae]MDW5986515.1 hypothetical protein [Klebsiella pneumoniae]SSL61434.1 Uncharacterised protein [Klebsiella pneumoniae]